MTAQQIRKTRDHAPFQPFTVFVSGQRKFEIRHPDFLWVVPRDRLIGVADENGAVEWIDLVQVTSLKVNGGANP